MNSKLSIAITTLQEIVAGLSCGARLPTTKECAKMAHVGYETMLKAINHYKKLGVIEARPGYGIRVRNQKQANSDKREETTLPHHERKWQQVVQKIQKEIMENCNAGQALPSLKQMAARLGTNYRTLRKALVHLENKGIIEQFKKTYRIPQLHILNKFNTTIVVFARGAISGRLLSPSSLFSDSFSLIEELCRASQIRLKIVTIGYHLLNKENGTVDYSWCESIIGSSDVIGAIFWVVGATQLQPQELIRVLLRGKKPVAVIDEEDVIPPLRVQNRHLSIFKKIDERTAGNRIASIVYSMGHRSIAYITPYTNMAWSDQRLTGIRDYFENVSQDVNLKVFAGRTKEKIDNITDKHLSRKTSDIIVEDLEINPETLSGRLQYDELGGNIYEAYTNNAWKSEVHVQVNTLIKDKSITAIIAANDKTAVECVKILRLEGIQIPTQCALVSFDNSENAAMWQIASYDFNGNAFARMAMRSILEKQRWGDQIGMVNVVDGFLAMRSSLG